MVMHFWDWAIVGGLLGLMTFAALSTRKYNKGVVDFLSAGRCARKYVLGVAEGLSCVGAISIVGMFETYYNGGFTVAWWLMVGLFMQVVVAMSGWVAYRYRQTRAMTLAQILEMRYSKNFRVFAGFVIFLSGTLNFGIFPAVAGRFFQYYFGWEPQILSLGGLEIDLIYAGIMAVLTIIALFFVFAGGQITIMLTDFIQGTFANICLAVIVVFILFNIPGTWDKIINTLSQRDGREFTSIEAVDNLDEASLKRLDAPDEFNNSYTYFIERDQKIAKKKGIKVPVTKKYIRSDIVLGEFVEEKKEVDNKEVSFTAVKIAKKQPDDKKSFKTPDEILLYVTPAEKLLPGTDHELILSYQSAGTNQYSMVVTSIDGRQESMNLTLPSSEGKVKKVVIPFTSTDLGSTQFLFTKAGTATTEFEIIGNTEILQKPNQSLFHPFKSGANKDFNLWFFLIQALVIFWTFKAWQGTQGYYSAAINAHEARMGSVVGNMRILVQNMMLLLIPITAYAILYNFGNNADQTIAAEVTSRLAELPTTTLQGQLRTTMVLTKILPVGLIGAFAAVMMAAFIGTNGTYMHSWGSIFVQDIYLPLNRGKKNLAPNEHFKILRWSIAGVGIFAFFFSLLFEQNSAILMYFAFTGNIWLGGAGAVIALGLYWKRGTTSGAYASIIIGMVLAILGFICERDYGWKAWTGKDFPLNAQWVMLISMVVSTTFYVVISLLTCRKPHNMDKLLRRGEYAGDDSTEKAKQSDNKKRKKSLLEKIGIDADFSFLDKVLYIFVTSWSFIMSTVFVGGLILHKTGITGMDNWKSFWHGYVIVAVVLGIITTIWFSVGGCVDLVDLLKRLKHQSLDEQDDGSVEGED